MSNQSEKPRFQETIAHALQKYRVFISVFFIAAFVIIVGIVVINEINIARSTESIGELDAALDKVNDYYLSTEEDNQEALDNLLLELDAIIEKYSGLYASQRALLVSGDLLIEEDRNEEALSKYLAVASQKNNSYLNPVALIKAYQIEEKLGNIEGAIVLLEDIAVNYADKTTEVPRALFNLGRLYELNNDPQKSIEYYQNLVDDHQGSGWTNLARSRIIYLKSQG